VAYYRVRENNGSGAGKGHFAATRQGGAKVDFVASLYYRTVWL